MEIDVDAAVALHGKTYVLEELDKEYKRQCKINQSLREEVEELREELRVARSANGPTSG